MNFKEQLEQLRVDLQEAHDNVDLDGVASLTLRIEVVERLSRLDEKDFSRRYCRAVRDLQRADSMDHAMLELMGFAVTEEMAARTQTGFESVKFITLTQTGKMAEYAYSLLEEDDE